MSETVKVETQGYTYLRDGESWFLSLRGDGEPYLFERSDSTMVEGEEVVYLLDALAAAQSELADWKANAQRENALLVQAHQRIAALEAEAQDVKRVGGNVLLAFEDWPAYQTASADGERRTALDSLAAALGRMLKEGE